MLPVSSTDCRSDLIFATINPYEEINFLYRASQTKNGKVPGIQRLNACMTELLKKSSLDDDFDCAKQQLIKLYEARGCDIPNKLNSCSNSDEDISSVSSTTSSEEFPEQLILEITCRTLTNHQPTDATELPQFFQSTLCRLHKVLTIFFSRIQNEDESDKTALTLYAETLFLQHFPLFLRAINPCNNSPLNSTCLETLRNYFLTEAAKERPISDDPNNPDVLLFNILQLMFPPQNSN